MQNLEKFEDEEEIDENQCKKYDCVVSLNLLSQLISETGVASEPHMYGDLLLTPEQKKVLLNEGPGSEEGMEQAFRVL